MSGFSGYKITKLEYPLNPYLMSSNVCKIPGGGLQCRLSLSNSQNDIKLILGKLLIVNVVDEFPILLFRERCKKKGKKLTNVSFAFTHTYTPVKTNIFPFFPQAYMENFEKCAKTQKQKNNMLSHVTCGC